MADASYRRIDVRPLTGALGAEIFGADLSRLDDEMFAEIHRAFLDHLVIAIRDQVLTPAQQKDFATRFGSLSTHRFLKGLDGHPEILEIRREPTDRKVFAEGWHSDVTYQERPVLGSMLYAKEVPAIGGDTLFANQYLAYDAMTPGMKALLDGLIGVHGGRNVYGDEPTSAITNAKLVADRKTAAETETEHPVVRTHPETGRKALFVNPHYTLRFKGWTEAESRPLLDFLFEFSVRPEFTCRLRWHEGSLGMWDNRCTQHTPIDDYFGKRRVMHRVTIEGDRPR
jgi:taurine dioxygenase